MAYRAIVLAYLVAQAALALYLYYGVGILTEVSLMQGFQIYPGPMVLILQGMHLVGSLKTIKVDDLAGVDFFGRPLFEPKSGLYVVPLFILTLTTMNRNYLDAASRSADNFPWARRFNRNGRKAICLPPIAIK
jgi:hypothetical protein